MDTNERSGYATHSMFFWQRQALVHLETRSVSSNVSRQFQGSFMGQFQGSVSRVSFKGQFQGSFKGL